MELSLALSCSIISCRSSHVLSSSYDFIDEEKLLSKDRSDVEELLLDNIVIPNVGGSSWQWLSSHDIDSECFTILDVFLLHFEKSILGIETRVRGESSWDDEEGISEAVNSELNFSGNLGLSEIHEVLSAGDLKRSSSWQDTVVLTGVLDGTETISDGVLGLSDTVVVWSLDQDGAGEWVLNTLDEGVLVISKTLLIDEASESEILLSDSIDRVELLSSASKWNSLSVSSLGATDSNDVGTGKDLKRWWVNSLLVDHDKVLVGSIAKLLLKLNNLVHLIISVGSLTLNQLLSLLSV